VYDIAVVFDINIYNLLLISFPILHLPEQDRLIAGLESLNSSQKYRNAVVITSLTLASLIL
jgi:hypothetical protein